MPAGSTAKIYSCGHAAGAHVSACMPRILNTLARRAFRRPVAAGEIDKVRRRWRAGAEADEESFDEGLVVGIQALLVSPDFLFRIERPSGDAADAASAQRDHAAPAGDAALVLPLGQHAGRGAAPRRRRGHAARSRACSPRRSRRMLRDPRVAGARRAVRRPVAAVPRARIAPRGTASAFPTSRTTCACRCGARRSCSSTTSSARIAASSTSSTRSYSFMNERLARHYGIAGVSGPEFRRVDLDRHAARRRADAGERADRVVVRDADLAGAARQVDSRQPAQRAAAGSAGRRAEPRRDDDRHGRVDARAAAGAPEESDLRVVPPPDGSARLRPRELRRRRRLAHRRRQVPDRRLRRPARRRGIHRARTSFAPSCAASPRPSPRPSRRSC